jgi:hypothetical protein
MKKKTITRRDVLAAIRTEPLRPGNWVVTTENVKCEVCAVGAVLRHAGLNNEEIFEFGDIMMHYGKCSVDGYGSKEDIEDTIQGMLRNNRYLHALSITFEFYSRRLGKGKRIRKVLANFVKKNFPKTIKLNERY